MRRSASRRSRSGSGGASRSTRRAACSRILPALAEMHGFIRALAAEGEPRGRRGLDPAGAGGRHAALGVAPRSRGTARAASASRAACSPMCGLNRVLAEQLPLEQIFIFPAMGDEGTSAGGALCYLQGARRPAALAGRSGARCATSISGATTANEIDAMLAKTAGVRRTGEAPLEGAARRLPRRDRRDLYRPDGIRPARARRALHPRQSVAARDPRPAEQGVARTEFMPFAPVDPRRAGRRGVRRRRGSTPMRAAS